MLTPQQWTDELVAQIEDSAEDPIVIEFYLDGTDSIQEFVLSDVKLEDEIIRCGLQVF